jgi:hypothetical protein
MAKVNVFIIKDGNHSAGHIPIHCTCIDHYTREFNPDCNLCHGTGIVEYQPPEIKWHGKPILATAEIIFENMVTMIEDDEPIPITDMLAYFSYDQDIAIGDIITYQGKNYRVVEREDVVGVSNDVSIRCALEPIV